MNLSAKNSKQPKMNNLREIVENIKDIICFDIKGIVFDKDVAEALGMEGVQLNLMVHRNSIPYEEICDFCAKRRIDINAVFYK